MALKKLCWATDEKGCSEVNSLLNVIVVVLFPLCPMPTDEQLVAYNATYSKDGKVDLTRRIGAHYPKLTKLFHRLSGDVDPRDFFESDQNNPKDQHHWHYNEASLTQLLLDKAGFTKAYRCDLQQENCADIELLDNRPESLFMEAKK